TTKDRVGVVPDVPTIGETVPGFDVVSWFAFWLPAKTPPEVVAKLNADTNAALVYPPVKSRFEELGAVPKGSSQAELAAFLQSETGKGGPVTRDAQIKVENGGGAPAGPPWFGPFRRIAAPAASKKDRKTIISAGLDGWTGPSGPTINRRPVGSL